MADTVPGADLPLVQKHAVPVVLRNVFARVQIQHHGMAGNLVVEIQFKLEPAAPGDVRVRNTTAVLYKGQI